MGWVEIGSAPGQILDVDAERILFVEAVDRVAILERRSGEVTSIPAPEPVGQNQRVTAGFLAPHGALVATRHDMVSPYSRLHEWRNGALELLGDLDSGAWLSVAGDHAMWADQPDLFLRDLDAGSTTPLGSGGNTSNMVAANGDAVWWGSGIVRRLASGTTTQLDADGTYPSTDGTNVVWRESDGAVGGVGPGGPFALAAARDYGPVPGRDYELDDGWIAFTRGNESASSVWRRDPAGGLDELAPGPPREVVLALNGDGETLYGGPFLADPAFLDVPGEAPLAVGSAPPESARGYGDFTFSAGGRWYRVLGGALERLSVGDAPTDGEITTIDGGPEGVESSSTAQFTFSSSVAGAAFECRLDGGAWTESCASPHTFPALDDGPHSFVVRAVEPGGDVDPEPASQRWTVDTATPAPTITAPPDDHVTNDPTPLLSGTAGDAYGDGAVSVDLYDGPEATGTPQRTFAASRNGTAWSVTVGPALADGTHTAVARQSDDGGHTGSSAPRTFTVDTQAPPPFAARGPADDAVVGPAPRFAWDEATDAGSGVDFYDVTVWGGGGSRVVVGGSCGSGECSLTLPAPLGSGDYTWQAQATDRAGHETETPTRAFTVDADPPTPFSPAGPADGARTADATPTLSWARASDTVAGVAGYEVLVDGQPVATESGTEHTPAAALADGPHTWQVVGVDAVGNRREAASRSFTVDTTAPAAVLRAVSSPALAGTGVVLDASSSTDQHSGAIVRHEWDLDGDGTFERDTGAAATTATSYALAAEEHPAVRVTDAVGHTAVATATVSLRPVPPAGLPGVSINDGARFTDDPDVTVAVVWPALAGSIVLANDGGFREAATFTVGTELPWTIDDSGSERLPRTIYARFLGIDGARETYQDDIILDQTAPRVLSAERTGSALRLRARDNVSGVRRLQLATKRSRPHRARPFRRRVVAPAAARFFVRVRDGAGNWSRWKRASA